MTEKIMTKSAKACNGEGKGKRERKMNGSDEEKDREERG